MPITEQESGLGTSAYNALVAADINPKWSVIAHKFNLDFEVQEPADTLDPVESDQWDACASDAGDFFVHYSNGHLFVFKEDPEDNTNPGGLSPALTNNAKSISMVESAGTAYIFTYNGTNIVRYEYTVSASVLSGAGNTSFDPALAGTEELTHLSAVSPTRVHFVVKTEDNLWNFRVAELDGSWSITESNIFYMYPIQNFSADTNGTIDAVVVATQTPGTVSIRNVNDTIEKYIEAAGGVICFKYKNGNWSDHSDVDVVDNLNDWRMRRGPRVTYMNGLFVATAYSVSGTEEYPFASYRMYTSKDAVHWSIGKIMPFDTSPFRRGMKIVPVGDHVIACDSSSIYRSWSTLEVGYSPDAMQVEITSDIEDYSIVQDKALQADITLSNADGAYDSNAIVNKDNTIALVHTAGYGANEIQVAITEVDYLDMDFDPTNKVIRMAARDRLAWMADKTQSEEARYWEGQLVGGDRYSDYTRTHYGGLRHTASQTGSWDTVDSVLQLRSNNEPGISFSTFGTYIWNGSYSTKFKLAKLNNTEHAGIVFRAIDKDNLMVARYVQADDKIHLIATIGGVEDDLVQSSTLSWSSALEWRYMKVDFRYGKIIVHTSGDGITWTTRITYYQEGQHDPGTYGPLILDRGYVGQMAKGWAPEITWTFPEFIIPDYQWFPPNLDLDSFEVDFLIDYESGDHNYALLVDVETHKLLFTSLFTSASPTWADKTPADDCYYACFGARNIPSGILEAWALTFDGTNFRVMHTDDILDDTPTWDQILTFVPTGTFSSAKCAYDVEYDAFAYTIETSTRAYVALTANDGSNWSSDEVTFATHTAVGYIDLGFVREADNVTVVYAYWQTAGTPDAYRLYGINYDTYTGADVIHPTDANFNDSLSNQLLIEAGQDDAIVVSDKNQIWLTPTTSMGGIDDVLNKASVVLLESANGTPTSDVSGNVYWEFANHGEVDVDGNFASMRWTFVDPFIYESTGASPEWNMFHVANFFGSPTYSFDLTLEYSSNLGGGTLTRTVTNSTNSSWTGDLPVSGELISQITFTMQVTPGSTLTFGGNPLAQFGVKNILGSSEYYRDMFLVENIWDEGTREWNSIAPIIGSNYFSHVDAIAVNKSDPGHILALAKSPFDSVIAQGYMRSSDSGVGWTLTILSGGPYDGCFLGDNNYSYAWKQNQIVDLSDSEVSKNGNIGTHLTVPWNIRTLEVLG